MSRKSSLPASRPATEPPFRRPIPVRALSRKQPLPFEIAPEPEEAVAIARFLGLAAPPSLRFCGELVPAGADGWRVEGRLTADLVQSCVVTLDPVAQQIDQAVAREYVPEEDYRPPAEIDLDPDAEDDPDPFGNVIDPGLLAIESLALALDPYPRKPGEAFEPETAQEAEERRQDNPFAVLSRLKKQ